MNAPAFDSAQTLQLHLVDQYGQRTPGSKRLAAQYRPVFADKSSIGFAFSPELKEISYPLSVERADGAFLWDVDGNRYTDILMGLGTHLFGHNPPFMREAIARTLERGFAIGPQSPLVGGLATLVCELTGMERATFSNTGTEAVMTALRIARCATGRRKVVTFVNSYHGHFDAALMRPPISDYARRKLIGTLRGKPLTGPLVALLERLGSRGAVPAFAGVSAAAARETMVLEYGHPRSLDMIRAQSKDIAAVLVEPVQSRCPELQPREFLQALRQLTTDTGIALVMDEMVNGFRVAAGGAQEWFGVRGDLATYSKIAGGGLPLSVIAGSARFMDRIDGGAWRYGDDSAPDRNTTFFAGTFAKHPLSLATAHAVLSEIRSRGPALYDGLNARTEALVVRLNSGCRSAGLPVEFVRFGSFFAIAGSRSRLDPQAQLLLSYLLLLRGIHLRIGDRGGFLSTAHGDAEVDAIAVAFLESLAVLRDAGLIKTSSNGDAS